MQGIILDADAVQLAQLAVRIGCASTGEGWLDALAKRKTDKGDEDEIRD